MIALALLLQQKGKPFLRRDGKTLRAESIRYRKSGYSKKFFVEHRAEITLHKAAKEAFNVAGGTKLPTIKELRQEYAQLIVQKKEAYKGYREAKREMQELLKARQNVEQFYGDDLKKEREAARQQRKEL